MRSKETVHTRKQEVWCDGGHGSSSAPLGHPRVFLHIDHELGHVVCPYCSRTFIYSPAESAQG